MVFRWYGAGMLRNGNRNLARTASLFAGLLVLAFGHAQPEPVLEGRVPAAVPEGAVVAAQIVSDGGAPVGERLVTSRIDDGRFELRLPARIAPSLVEEELLGCDAADLVPLAYLPHLTVLQDGEAVGRLVLTDVPPELWSFGGAPKHAYWLYTIEAFRAEGECRGAELEIALEPGWNPVLVIQGPDGVSFTTEPAPEAYVWRWAPAE
jgi:hypothetical protein